MRLVVLLACLAILFGGLVLLGRDTRDSLPDNAQATRIVVEKSAHKMSLFHDQTVLRVYEVSLGSGGPDAKMREGDRRTPEGRFVIDGRNTKSRFHRALHISYPTVAEVASAKARGDNPGGDVLIHGLRDGFGWIGTFHRTMDWTAGCIAVTDREMDEIWRVVPNGTPIEIVK
jgi:murein L,D-transpeptidase YafK